jgi:REP element-mobilizing transposase RayT
MPKNLKRYYGQGHLHFITCSCYRRLPLLRSARARNALARILGQVRQRYGFALVGYVVMPEHIIGREQPENKACADNDLPPPS